MSVSHRSFACDRGDAAHRLDHVLRRHLAGRLGASRTRIQEWIRGGDVRVNGVVCRRVAGRVDDGDQVSVTLPELPDNPPHEGEALPVQVIYEDDHLLAVNKPAGLIVHPSFGHASGTLMNALLWRSRDWPEGQRPSLVTRLDKLTSGVLVVAKSSALHAQLARTLSGPRAEKDYLAIVAARVPRARGAITLRLARDPADRRRVIGSLRSGRESLTTFERLGVSRGTRVGLTLLRCRIATGRMHQVRAHLFATGWPLVGDPVYGPGAARRLADPKLDRAVRTFGRQALHAWRLAFDHPLGGHRLELFASVPPDLEALLRVAGLTVPRAEA